MSDHNETKQAPAVEAVARDERAEFEAWWASQATSSFDYTSALAGFKAALAKIEIDKLIAERDAAIMSTHRQALCIHQCAAHIGPETPATIDGLPLAVRRVVLERDEARVALASASDHKFKNFHRLLCERFGYVHDEKDWKRDQVSSIEWIASGASEAVAGEPVSIMDAALTEICNWPDGGNRYGQGNIKRFAKEKLDEARRMRFNAAPQPASEQQVARGLSKAQKELCDNLRAPQWTADDGILMEEAANEIEYLAGLLAAKGDGHE
jgi:hypothetical protein